MFRFTIRELSIAAILTTGIASIMAGWWLERSRLLEEIRHLQSELESAKEYERNMQAAKTHLDAHLLKDHGLRVFWLGDPYAEKVTTPPTAATGPALAP